MESIADTGQSPPEFDVLELEPKILLGCPISSHKDYCLFRWLAFLGTLTYRNLSILLIDNSPLESHANEIRALGFDVIWVDPAGRTSREFMCECNNIIRDRVLSGGFSYLFSLECDIFPPVSIIEKLLAFRQPVTSVPYFTGFGSDRWMLMMWIGGEGRYRKVFNFDKITGFLFIDGQAKELYANGIGCALVENWVLEEVPFRINLNDTGHADSFFYQDLWLKGIPNIADTSISLRHENSDWATIIENH